MFYEHICGFLNCGGYWLTRKWGLFLLRGRRNLGRVRQDPMIDPCSLQLMMLQTVKGIQSQGKHCPYRESCREGWKPEGIWTSSSVHLPTYRPCHQADPAHIPKPEHWDYSLWRNHRGDAVSAFGVWTPLVPLTSSSWCIVMQFCMWERYPYEGMALA